MFSHEKKEKNIKVRFWRCLNTFFSLNFGSNFGYVYRSAFRLRILIRIQQLKRNGTIQSRIPIRDLKLNGIEHKSKLAFMFGVGTMYDSHDWQFCEMQGEVRHGLLHPGQVSAGCAPLLHHAWSPQQKGNTFIELHVHRTTYYFLKLHLHHFSKIKSWKSHRTVGIKVFLNIFAWL